jgi:hypothetical protein
VLSYVCSPQKVISYFVYQAQANLNVKPEYRVIAEHYPIFVLCVTDRSFTLPNIRD